MKKIIFSLFVFLLMIGSVFPLEQTSSTGIQEGDSNIQILSFWEKYFKYAESSLASVVVESGKKLESCSATSDGAFNVFSKMYDNNDIVSVGKYCSDNALVRLYRCNGGVVNNKCINPQKAEEAYKVDGKSPSFTEWMYLGQEYYYSYACFTCQGESDFVGPPSPDCSDPNSLNGQYACKGGYVLKCDNGNYKGDYICGHEGETGDCKYGDNSVKQFGGKEMCALKEEEQPTDNELLIQICCDFTNYASAFFTGNYDYRIVELSDCPGGKVTERTKCGEENLNQDIKFVDEKTGEVLTLDGNEKLNGFIPSLKREQFEDELFSPSNKEIINSLCLESDQCIKPEGYRVGCVSKDNFKKVLGKDIPVLTSFWSIFNVDNIISTFGNQFTLYKVGGFTTGYNLNNLGVCIAEKESAGDSNAGLNGFLESLAGIFGAEKTVQNGYFVLGGILVVLVLLSIFMGRK